MKGPDHIPFDFDVSAYPPLPKLKGLLVTGTDTDVGKTLIAGAIARNLRHSGRSVEVFKPAATGCPRRREGLVSEDAEFLAACADSRRMLSDIAPVRYVRAVAPNVAASLSGEKVDLPTIFSAYERLAGAAEVVIVEGVGGLLCPISDDFWVIHFARLIDLAVVIVARANLGTINHTLLTLHAARSAGLNLAGVVINRFREEGLGPNDEPIGDDERMAMLTNPEQIARCGKIKVLARVPLDPETSVPQARIGEAVQMAIDGVNWMRLIGS